MTVSRTIAASYLVAFSSLTACMNRHRSLEEAPIPASAPETVVLEVENHNWSDVVLYIVHDGVQTRFTQVAAAHDLSVEIPTRLQGQMGVIRLAARRIGGTDSYVSQALSIRGSSAVRLTIESSLSHSSVGVW
jgi:hypothetical protein